MHRFVHKLAMIVVLYHMVVGCCAHHAHATSIGGSDEGAHAADSCSHEEEGHREGEHGHECPTERPHQHSDGCQDGPCVFTLRTTSGAAELLGSMSPAATLCVDAVTAIPVLPGDSALEAPPAAGRPPLRLHLVNQILLI